MRFRWTVRWLSVVLVWQGLSGAGVGAEGAGSVEEVPEAFVPRSGVADASFLWSPAADVDGGGEVEHLEADARFSVPVWRSGDWMATAGVRYRWTGLDFSEGVGGGLGDESFDLHRVEVPVSLWGSTGERWRYWLRVAPGLASDGEAWGDDAFQVSVLATVSYRWFDSLDVVFGGYYSQDLGEARLLPALGLIWRPDDAWSVALTFPRLEVSYAPSDDWLVGVRAAPVGGGWRVEDPAGGGGEVDLEYSAMRVMGVVERRLGEVGGLPVWGYVEAGALVGREVELDGVRSRDVESGFGGMVGLKVRF